MLRRIALLLVLLSLFIAPTFAQQDIACGGLNDADCELYANAFSQLGMESADFNLSVDYEFDDPANPFLDMSFGLVLDGSFEFDQAEFDALIEEFSQFTVLETPDQLVDLMAISGDLFKTFNADVTLEVYEGEATNLLGEPEPLFAMDLALVDGTGYANMDSVADFVPDVPSGWHGTSIPSGMRYLSTLVASFMPEGSDLSDLGVTPMVLQQDYSDAELAELEALTNNYIQIARGADVDFGDEMVAVFKSTIDFGEFFSSPIMQDALRQQFEMQNPMMSEAELEELMTLTPMIFESMNADYSVAIGLDSGVLREMTMSIDFEDFGDFIAEMDPSAESELSMTADLSLRYDNINNAAPIVAPADATVYPAATLFLGAMGMVGGQS